jgi:tetratricopeptide (TPR) repeat protein
MDSLRMIALRTVTRVVGRSVRSPDLMGIGLCVATCALAAGQCSGPPALEARLKANPTAETYANLGNWFADKKQFDCAAAAFASASGLQPQSSSLAYLWGLSLFSAGQDAAAVDPLDKAMRVDPSDIRPHLVLGGALDRLKRTADAEAEWRAALAIDPDSAIALDSLSQDLIDAKDYASVVALLDKSGKERIRTPVQSLNLGIAYAGRVELDKAVNVLREGMNNNPDSLPIANELAVLLMLVGRDDQAYAVFDLALARHPDDEPTQILYLHTLVSSHSDKATELAHKLLAAHPDQWEVLYLNAVLESRDGDLAAARAHLERSVALNPTSSQAHHEFGSVLSSLGELPAAREHLEKAIDLGDNQPEVEYDLAQVLKRLGETAQAKEKLDIYQKLKSAQSQRTQAAGKAEVGDEAMKTGDTAKAVTLYKEALESNLDEPLLYYKLSSALDKSGDIDGERAALQRAIQLNPNLAEAQIQMGFLSARAGDLAQAEGFFRAAVKASPSHVVAWINLAATLASEAKLDEAKQAVGHALEIDPDNPQARRLSHAISEDHPGP